MKPKTSPYRKILEKKAEEVRHSMSAQKAAQVVSRLDIPSDEGDLSQQHHEEWIFLNRNTIDMKLLREIADALHRMDTDQYGVCPECEEPISAQAPGRGAVGALLRDLPGADRGPHRRWRGDRRISGSRPMTLVDLRKLAIRKQSKIRFALRNGMECVISEDGIARVPALKAVPDFNLEQELAARHGRSSWKPWFLPGRRTRPNRSPCRWAARN